MILTSLTVKNDTCVYVDNYVEIVDKTTKSDIKTDKKGFLCSKMTFATKIAKKLD